MELEGDYKSFDDFTKAFTYLKRYSFGMLKHIEMESDSFIFLKANGAPYFYDANKDDIEPLQWKDLNEFADTNEWEGIDNRGKSCWYYIPGSEIHLTNGGIDFWKEITQSPNVLEHYYVIGESLTGERQTFYESYSYMDGIAAIEALEHKHPNFGFDILDENRFKKMVKKFKKFVKPGNMEDDLLDDLKAKHYQDPDPNEENE